MTAMDKKREGKRIREIHKERGGERKREEK
jgi:hypothetical protein